jgi:hypothetical protein
MIEWSFAKRCGFGSVRSNGLGLGEVGEIEAQMSNKPQMLIEVRMFKFSTSAPILPNPC